MTQTPWKKCLDEIASSATEEDYALWIKPLQFAVKNDYIMVLATNEIILRGFQKRFESILNKVIHTHFGYPLEIRYGIGTESDFSDHHEQSQKSPPKIKRQKTGNAREITKASIKEKPIETSNLNREFVFDNFVEGKSNQFALAACSQVAKNPGTTSNPLFIYGSTGLGKTHLMHAIGNSINVSYPDARLIYQHCDSFIEDIVRAIRNNTLTDLRHFYKSLDALLIDDIQLLSGKEGSQEIFFHTFNTLLDGGHQVILTCDRYPKELDQFEDRLTSRFASGLIVNIEPPELEHRIAILMKKADNWELSLPDETAFFIAQTVRASVRELEGALKQVSALANFKGLPLSVEVAKESLSSLLESQSRRITLQNIQKVVTDYYGLKSVDLTGKSRASNIAKPRQLAMYIARTYTEHSLPEIGRAFCRDHSTVMHACTKMAKDLNIDSMLNRDFCAIKASLGL